MAIEYLGLSEINGPLVVLEGVKNAAYEEIVEFTIDGKEKNWDVSWRSTRTKQSFRSLKALTICL